MATIRNNKSGYYANYMKGNKQVEKFFMPGITFNVPEEDIEAMMKSEIVKAAFDEEILEVLTKEPTNILQFDDQFKVVDSRRTGEPLPVHDMPRTTAIPDAPKPEERLPILSKSQLLEYPGIGDGYAQKIISRQPEGGYESFGQLKGLNSDLIKLKEDNWTEIQEALKK